MMTAREADRQASGKSSSQGSGGAKADRERPGHRSSG
jgi:hypothetical protein